MPPIPPPRTSGFTRTTGLPLYWCAYGAAGAPRLLILHGGPGADHEYLLPQMLRLAGSPARRDLLFYDQRGAGRSRSDDRAAEGDLGWEAHVLDLERVIAELAAEPLVLVGYSWGGLLALLYIREALEGRVAPLPGKLLLIDPAPVSRVYRAQFEAEFARRQSGPEVQAMRAELAGSGLRERDPEQFRHRSFELSVAGYFANPRAAHNLTPFRVTGRVQQAVWESLGDYDLLEDERLSTFDRPVMIVHGRDDPIPLASTEACARALGARLVVLDRCGHVPYVEQPDALFASVERFLAAE
ncbi:MAG TPA: alpha/beta fold hydrolase [Gemmatimonadaceae bacterium]|nr:alpha/beta fold hydrolase [Gemmatimonadaceae bacterium]